MKHRRHQLIVTIFSIALITGVMSYLFHPDIGALKLIINNQPVDDAIVRFAAIPGGVMVTLLIAILAVLVIIGAGALLFLMALSLSMIGVFLIAPFFWPLLLVIFLMLALMSVDDSRNDDDN